MPHITVGVLALQGAFVEHIKLLRQAAEELVSSQLLPDRSREGEQISHANAARTTSKAYAADAHDADADILAHTPLPAHQGDLDQDKLSTLPKVTGYPTEQRDVDVASRSYTGDNDLTFDFVEVRTPGELAACDALILPGGESTSISLIADRTGLLEPLRDFVKVERKPVWGTCAGLILLAESANKSKSTGQELIGGLDVRVQRNYFGRQVESFEAELELPFLHDGPFHSVFIRAPVVERVLSPDEEQLKGDDAVLAPAKQPTTASVEVLGRLPGRARTIRDRTATAEDLGEDGDIIAVKQGNVFGTAFHPELTGDGRIHAWWLRQVIDAVRSRGEAS